MQRRLPLPPPLPFPLTLSALPASRKGGGGDRPTDRGDGGRRLRSLSELRRSAANTHILPAASAAAVSALGK